MTQRETLASFVEAVHSRDAAAAAALFAPGARYRESHRATIAGRDRIGEHFERFFAGGRAFEFDVQRVIEEGDRCALAYRFATVDAGGESIEREGVAIIEFSAGLITTWREYEGS